jgi:hypothetical protein
MPINTTHTRDAALRQLHQLNRWLIAGSVVLTGVFVEAAAHAFPGKSTTTSASKAKRSRAHTSPPPNPHPRRNPRRLHRNLRHLSRNRPQLTNRLRPRQKNPRPHRNRLQRKNLHPPENRLRRTNRHPRKNRLQSCPAAPEMPTIVTPAALGSCAWEALGTSVVRRAHGSRARARRDRPGLQPLPGRLRAVLPQHTRGPPNAGQPATGRSSGGRAACRRADRRRRRSNRGPGTRACRL